jgi:hypothetical protein
MPASRLFRLVALMVALAAHPASAIDLDLSRREMEQVLAIARRPEAGRAAFHAPYIITVGGGELDRVEIITERRRLALIAAERIAGGDPLFTRGTLRAEEALRPWRRRVAIAAAFSFPVLNAYTLSPPVDISLAGGDSRRLDMRTDTQFAIDPGIPGRPVPVVGARAEAVFDAVGLATATRTIVIRLGAREITRVPIDFRQVD